MAKHFLVFCVFACLWACESDKSGSDDWHGDEWSDDTGRSVLEDEVSEGGELRLVPDRLDFGSLGRDDDPVVKQFDIMSVGGIPVMIESLHIESVTASFSILTDVTDTRLDVGELLQVDVAFEPLGAYEQIGTAVVTSDAVLPRSAHVLLEGEGSIPELQISPDPIDVGTVFLGCEKPARVTLTNVGTDTLEIYDIGQSEGAFQITSMVSFPFSLEPDEDKEVWFEFAPSEDGEASGTLTVASNEPLETREANQVGTGEYGAFYEEEWVVGSDPPADILFYVDQSGSMSDDQARLASNFSTFITELNTYSEDWQIVVANADNGCNAHEGVLTPAMADYTTRFQSAVSSGGGFWTEAGLTIASEAIEQTDAGECNWGFLRPDAMLHIIMVSDEQEQSSSSWDWYMDKIVSKKGSSARVKFSAIAGDYPEGCATADPGDGYHQVVEATDGVFLSICSDWATPSNLSMLAEASVQRDTFELDAMGFASTVQVYVNGSERFSGWYFDEDDNAVVFEESIPAEGDVVRVTYGSVGTCD